MNLETPNKCRTNNSFTPLILPISPAAGSPQKKLTGIPRVVRDLTADLYNNIQRWNDHQIRGSVVVKQIVLLKENVKPNIYPPELDTAINELWDIVQKLKVYRDFFETLITQIKAVGKLQHKNEPVFSSLEIRKLSNYFTTICNAYIKEYKIKVIALEHIAHCKNKSEAMFLASGWTHQHNISNDICIKLEALLIETGHRKYN